ncbi:MAG: tRNA preQ1(34) S-adenosylmethionine ribosyltransferase-isomerase QueA [Planctomycetaceae bacterium]|nr:tRNA preQ1(34) S-adenosylmethionine ribosyltransferase-isomerase QueA [Planctomycetaceae bacterium]
MSDALIEYDFELPQHLIAQHPLADRSAARLLVVHRESSTIEHKHVHDLPYYFYPGDTLVFNDTKVIPARLIGNRSRSGGKWEGLFLGFGPDRLWKILCKTRGRLIPGETITLVAPNGQTGFPLEMVAKSDEGSWLVKPRTDDDTFAALEKVGWIPIPPYIRSGKMNESDKTDYQTVFAQKPGAIAAPTAGLHFTPPLLDAIEAQGTARFPITLHVGVGTFKPIAVERLSEHQMHSEWGTISTEIAGQINARRKQSGRTVAVGTTSVRVLESAADENGLLHEFRGETDLFIRPPYRFKAVDCLLTNFHFPKSTLYVLVRTFGGDELIKKAYQEAIRQEYRFFSYGDAMLIV